MKKLCIVIALLSLILMTGCGYSKEEKQERAKILKQGKINCITYIEEKYGFSPKIENAWLQNVDTSPVPDFSPPATGYVWAECKYDGKSFMALVDGQSEEIIGRDDYQYDDIIGGIESILTESLGDKPLALDVRYGTECNKTSTCLIDTYFTGDFLGLFDETYSLVYANYVNKDLSSVDQSLYSRLNCQVLQLVSFSSEDDAMEFKGSDQFSIRSHTNTVQEILRLDNKNSEYEKFEYETHDIFTFNRPVTLSPWENMPEVEYWNGRGFIDAEYISKGYQLSCDSKNVQISVAFSDLDYEEEDRCNFVMLYEKDGEDKNQIIISYMYNGYLIGTFHLYEGYENVRFAVCKDNR